MENILLGGNILLKKKKELTEPVYQNQNLIRDEYKQQIINLGGTQTF